jgi:hypothetical protein
LSTAIYAVFSADDDDDDAADGEEDYLMMAAACCEVNNIDLQRRLCN